MDFSNATMFVTLSILFALIVGGVMVLLFRLVGLKSNSKISESIKDSTISGDYVGRDLVKNLYDNEKRGFVISRNANIKKSESFSCREKELRDLHRLIDEEGESVLLSGIIGVGKTALCKALFNEYLNCHKKGEAIYFEHIGYFIYEENINKTLVNGLKFERVNGKSEIESAWIELEKLSENGRLLFILDNMNETIKNDPALERLCNIPGVILISSRFRFFKESFLRLYELDFLSLEDCVKIYKKISEQVNSDEIDDLEYIIKNIASKHTFTIEMMAKIEKSNNWSVKHFRKKLENIGFDIKFHKDGSIVNMQKEYEKLFSISCLEKGEKNILEAFSLFPHEELTLEQCNSWLLKDSGFTENDESILELYQKGWLQRNDKSNYYMHPVFCEVIYNINKPQSCEHKELLDLLMFDFTNCSILESKKIESLISKVSMKLCLNEITENYEFWYELLRHFEFYRNYDKCLYYGNILISKLEVLKDMESLKMKKVYLYLMGDASTNLGMFDKAEEYYTKGTMLEHEIEALHLGFADIYIRKGEFKKAEEYLLKFIESVEQSIKTDYIELEKYKKALTDLENKKRTKDINLKKNEISSITDKLVEDESILISAKVYLANMYEILGSDTIALEIYESLFKKYKNSQDRKMVYICSRAEAILEKAREMDLAKMYHNFVLDYRGLNGGFADGYSLLETYYAIYGDYKNALFYGLKAFKILCNLKETAEKKGSIKSQIEDLYFKIHFDYHKVFSDVKFKLWLQKELSEPFNIKNI